MASQLSIEQLVQLEARWRSADTNLPENLQPGLDADEARAIVAPLGDIYLTDELLLWWGWHNGVPGPGMLHAELAPGRDFACLEEAVAMTQSSRNVYEIPHLLQITTEIPTLFAECHPDRPTTSRIHAWPHSEDPVIAAESLGELVEIWDGLLDSGGMYFDGGFAHLDEDKVPESVFDRWLF